MLENSGLGLGNTMPYNNSKLANALFSKELGKRLNGTRVKTYSVCPGLARSNIFQHYSTTGKISMGLGKYTFFLPVNKVRWINFDKLIVWHIHIFKFHYFIFRLAISYYFAPWQRNCQSALERCIALGDSFRRSNLCWQIIWPQHCGKKANNLLVSNKIINTECST